MTDNTPPAAAPKSVPDSPAPEPAPREAPATRAGEPPVEGADRETSPRSCPIAAFGASAGGLEAFTEVLQSLPPDTGLAIVFIQHLDPSHPSILAELLAPATKMPVTQATTGVPLEPDHVYVIPPNTTLSLSRGQFQMAPRKPGIANMPVDQFFRSLAAEQGSKAIGIVLSGTASDGTLGLKAIKEEGGITFAQSPESARYDGMPRSAIAAGCVDFALPPAGIVTEFIRLARHFYLSKSRPAEADGDFAEIFAMLRQATSVDFSHYKSGTVRRRTLRRMTLHRFDALPQYIKYLKDHRDELDLLFQDLLINVTSFFREPATFEALAAQIPGMLNGRSPDDLFRVWVPGCSTGEEPYSVAITLLEKIRESGSEIPIQVFGTDLSESALQKARTGIYPDSISLDVSADRLRRYFVRSEGSYQIARFVRDLCVFARQDVTKDPPFSRLDLITCRNVLIYLGPVLQAKVMRLFHYALKSNGLLVLGASEHLGAFGEGLFQAIDKQHRIFARKGAGPGIAADFARYEEAPPGHLTPVSRSHGLTDSQFRVDRMILARYAPPAIVIDNELRILQFRGDTTPYLAYPSGEASLDLMKLTRAGLGSEIRKLVDKTREESTPSRSEVIALADGKDLRWVRISVTAVYGAADQYLIVFETAQRPAAEAGQAKGERRKGRGSDRSRALEQELTTTRQYLQSVIEEQEAASEELKSAHEELQSSNEELQSTNEELLTAKEELQSTNEELTTVNEEMLSRNAELQQTNNDLSNLLNSVNIPILMLDNDLRIRRFTPQAEKILNLIAADKGRPISDFRLKINISDLIALCQDVIDHLTSREREVEDADGRVYSMWVRPYRTADNRIDGAVLVWLDVTDRKRSVEARYRRLFEAAQDGIVIVDAVTGEIIDSNPFVAKLTGYPRAKLVGVKFWQSLLFAGTDIGESLLMELQERESVHKTPRLPTDSGDHVETDVVASVYTEGDRKVIQFNIRDVSARRKLEELAARDEEQQRQAQKMESVGRLAGGVVHDFNNILTAVLGHASLLEQYLPPGSAGRPMLDQIRTAGERAIALTRQLLAFGRKQIVAPAVLDPNRVVGEMRQMINVMLRENINFQMSLRPEIGGIRADRSQVEQIVLNLVLNARDAIAESGTITISTANVDVDEDFSERHPTVPVGRYVAISVKDTGSGMDAGTQARMFEPFFTTKPKGAGAGLGLSTVYNIARENGGYIRAYSELGIGSEFVVYLPRVEAPAAAAETKSAPRPDGAGSETVLLVEDENAVRLLARRFLEMRGYTVFAAAGGPDALRVSREHKGPIHLLLTDVVMPRMSGREVALQLASERPEMKVVFMSGHTDDAIIHHGVLEKGVVLVQKPFTQEQLLTSIRRVLDAPAAEVSSKPDGGAMESPGLPRGGASQQRESPQGEKNSGS